jgi:hypothetical protein
MRDLWNIPSMTRIRACTRALPAFLALACLQPALAGPSLTPYAAEYKIRISVLGGKLNTRVALTETGYMAESVIRATGLSRLLAGGSIREKSWFSEGNDRILPDQYRSTDTLSRDHQNVDLDFDWDADEVSGLINGEDFHAILQGEVHDRVSLQYGLMYDLLSDGANGEYLLQDAEERKTLTVTNIGLKPVEVPFGTFEALGIQHQRVGSTRVTTLWCVEELGYLPVVIEQHRDGKLRLRAELTKYTALRGATDGS